jgi:hypothetical protein
MLYCLSDRIRKLAFMLEPEDYYGESPYLNIPIYQQRIEPEEDSKELGNGPQSLYEDPAEERKEESKKDMLRQGPNPEVDIYEKNYLPVTDTVLDNPKDDAQGEVSDNTTSKGRNEDEDTIGFDPGTLIDKPDDSWS